MKQYRYSPGDPCPGNSTVICPDHSKCNRCGWNPEIAAKRLTAVIEDLKQKRREQNGKHN